MITMDLLKVVVSSVVLVVIVVRIRKMYLAVFLGISLVCPFPAMKEVLLRRAGMMMVKNLLIIVQL